MANTFVVKALPSGDTFVSRLEKSYGNDQLVTAEDTVQDAWVKVLTKEPKHVGNASGYFWKICKNKAIDLVRKRDCRNKGRVEFIEDEIPGAYRTPLEKLITEDEINRRRIMLTKDQNAVLSQRLERMTDREISENLGVSSSAVRMRMLHARKRISKMAA